MRNQFLVPNFLFNFHSVRETTVLPALVQHDVQYAVTPIWKIYRASLATGYNPLSWRIARVSFIPKPGRLDNTNSKAFPPISLTSFLFFPLCLLFNAMLNHAFVPDDFRFGINKPLLKNKHDQSKAETYRGITLTPVIAKLFESVLLSLYGFFVQWSFNVWVQSK